MSFFVLNQVVITSKRFEIDSNISEGSTSHPFILSGACKPYQWGRGELGNAVLGSLPFNNVVGFCHDFVSYSKFK